MSIRNLGNITITNGSDRCDSRQQPTSPQVTHVHVHNNRGYFWYYFLLRSLFSGNTTVINNLGSGSNNQPNREDKKKDAEKTTGNY
ncbi:hypothetical protein [Wolbachia endosymbiont of Trichogramma kaykai]|uniref:hypothetical protein n=1 Tax=Wolbachia endosymbiont of Trichogramma kaykai TaxID=444066 RepID=UPI003892848E